MERAEKQARLQKTAELLEQMSQASELLSKDRLIRTQYELRSDVYRQIEERLERSSAAQREKELKLMQMREEFESGGN